MSSKTLEDILVEVWNRDMKLSRSKEEIKALFSGIVQKQVDDIKSRYVNEKTREAELANAAHDYVMFHLREIQQAIDNL